MIILKCFVTFEKLNKEVMLYDLSQEIDRKRAQQRYDYLLQKGKVIELTEHVARTNSQNAYLHVLLRVLAMEFGEGPGGRANMARVRANSSAMVRWIRSAMSRSSTSRA